MRIIVSVILMFVSFLLQSTIFARFSIGGIIPNICVVAVASIGFLNGRKAGLFLGFTTGLLMDVFYGSILGVYSLFFMYLGFANGQCKRILYAGDFKLPLFLIAVSDFCLGHLCYFFMFFIKGDFNYLFYLYRIILPELLYTVVFAVFLYPVIDKIFRYIEKRERILEGDEVA